MKSIVSLFIISCLLILMYSCGQSTPKDYSKEVDEGTFKDTTYTSEVLGWSMDFPANWTITSKSSLEQLDQRSKEISNNDSNTQGIKRTLAFQKNFNNNFQSTWETYEGTKQDYKAFIRSTRESIYNNYLDQRVTMDTVTSTLKIGNVVFDVFSIKLYDRTGKNYATQLLYTTIRNQKLMTVTIAYDNDLDKKRITDLFNNSIFR